MDQVWEMALEPREKQNVISVQMAMNCLNDGLKDYREAMFQRLHNRLQATLLHVQQVCPGNCSKNIADVRNWCHTCSAWRTAILGSHRHRTRTARSHDWTKFDSSKWPTDFKEVMKVFNPELWKPLFNDEDISVTLNAMLNCAEFTNTLGLSTLREIRNKCHHQISFSDNIRHSYCTKIITFLEQPAMQQDQRSQRACDHVKIFRDNTFVDIIQERLLDEEELIRGERLIFKEKKGQRFCERRSAPGISLAFFVLAFAVIYVSLPLKNQGN